jgi:hypothetical protein
MIVVGNAAGPPDRYQLIIIGKTLSRKFLMVRIDGIDGTTAQTDQVHRIKSGP